jgi:hypothetical protein
MASNLLPEKPLLFSPTLAATIGLEEAILLQVLMDFVNHRPGIRRDGYQWVEIGDSELLTVLPFWKSADIRRFEASLRNLGMLLRNPDTARQDSYLYALNQQVSEAVAPAVPASPAGVGKTKASIYQPQEQGSTLPADWAPGPEWLAQCRLHNIPDQFALSLVPEFVSYWRDRGQARFSWGNAFYRHVLRSWREEQARQGSHELATTMDRDWRPSADALEILVNAGIPANFIEDAVPEFVLYWRERGVQLSTWNTRFIDHIRRQWDKYTVSFGHDSTPRPIPADWQPSPACYEILALAEIDTDYARAKVAEFVLYWRDSQQAKASWNTAFLQYVKQDWARRLNAPLEVESGHGKHRSPAGENRTSVAERLRQLTDRSWAETARRW